MKSIKIESQIIASRVTSFFQHPTHYFTLVQTQKQQIHLYDQKTMSIIGISNKNYSQMIKCVAFTENFNITYAYFQGKLNLRSSTYNPYFVRMELKEDSVLDCQNIFISNANFRPNEGFMSMAYLNNQSNQVHPIFAFINCQNCFFVSHKGQILKINPISPKNLKIPNFRAQKCIHISNGDFLLSFKQILFAYQINGYEGILHRKMNFQQQIQFIFSDSTLNSKYISIVTKDQTIFILLRSNKQLYIKSSIGYSYFKPTIIDFFYLSPNSSSTNKYKNLVFLLFQGIVTLKKQRRLTNDQINQSQLRSGLSNSSSFCSKSLYIYSFEEIHDDNNENELNQLTLKQSNIFYMKNIGLIKGLFNNCHQLNSIITLSSQNQLVSYDLKNIFDEKVDQKWIYWIYHFELTKKRELEYLQQEDELRKNQKKYESAKSDDLNINKWQNYLNDWSLSCLSKQMIINLKTARLNGLKF